MDWVRRPPGWGSGLDRYEVFFPCTAVQEFLYRGMLQGFHQPIIIGFRSPEEIRDYL